jgi:DHA3 family macrolide efflux protein-like MFS transporter
LVAEQAVGPRTNDNQAVTTPAGSDISRRSVSILRDPAFGRLWFIQAATQVGGNMALYALTVLVFATTRSNAAVSALVMSFLLPTIALSAMAGVVVDRLNLRWALVVPNVARAAMTLGLALAGTNVPVLLLLNLGISFTTVMLTPAEAAMIPRIVGRTQLETAMGVFNLTLQASFAIGFAFLGPLLVTIAGPSFVLGVVTVFYVAATIACLGLPSAPPAGVPPGVASRAMHEPMRQLREGFAAIHGNREVSRPLLHLAASASLVGVLGVLGPALASSIGLEPERLVVVVLPLGLGVVAGVLGLRRFGRGVPRRRAAEAGLTAFGLLTIGVALVGPLSRGAAPLVIGIWPEAVAPAIPIVIVLAFLAGAAYAATTVSAQTALFEHMPAEVRGRVFGVLASIVSAASLLPILIAGPLADKISAPLVLLIVGSAVVATGIASARLFGPNEGD